MIEEDLEGVKPENLVKIPRINIEGKVDDSYPMISCTYDG
jgi:hypothetical protein